MKKYDKVLTIAGSDSGGGAGIQADLKAIAACGGYGMTAITALTAQNTMGVRGIHPVPIEFLERQLQAIAEDMGTDAVKIGMLHSSEVIRTVEKQMHEFGDIPIVLDPVMVATSGDKLLEDDAIDTLKKVLIPKATLITPNLPEAQLLLETAIDHEGAQRDAAQKLGEIFQTAVLVKGGHFDEQKVTDYLYMPSEQRVIPLPATRIVTNNTHGTGCTLSSAIATFLAKRFALREAVEKGKAYLYESLASGKDFSLGKGHGPVHHFYAYW